MWCERWRQTAPALFERIHELWVHHTQTFVNQCSAPISPTAAPSIGPEMQTHVRFALLALKCLRQLMVHGLRQAAEAVPVAHVCARQPHQQSPGWVRGRLTNNRLARASANRHRACRRRA